MCVPNIKSIKDLILDEYHKVPYVGHPRYQKLLTALRKKYFSPDMKKEVDEYLVCCLECQQVKIEHCYPANLLHPLPVLESKWELISIDFIMGLPRLRKHNESIMVVVHKLSKSTHFIPVKSNYKVV